MVYPEVESFFKERFSADKELDMATAITEEFFNLLIDKNFEEAYEYLSSADKEYGSMEDFSDEFRDVTDIVSVDINWVEVKSNIATVGIDLTDSYDGEEKIFKDIEVSLIKEDEDGDWKIVFWKK